MAVLSTRDVRVFSPFTSLERVGQLLFNGVARLLLSSCRVSIFELSSWQIVEDGITSNL